MNVMIGSEFIEKLSQFIELPPAVRKVTVEATFDSAVLITCEHFAVEGIKPKRTIIKLEKK